MFVKSIGFENYRNLENAVVYPEKGINVICGNNAQGKTNLIECLWLFTGGRSFRGSKESEMITFGEKISRIFLNFYSEEREQTIEIDIAGGKRRAVLNDVPKSYMSQIVGNFCAVVFSPDHLTLIKNGPEERRGFINGALCQIKPRYAAMLSKYKKILNERNALLKDIPRHRELEDTLEIWDEKLAEEGALVAVERFRYIEKLMPEAVAFYEGISDGKENLEIEYKMKCGCEPYMDRYEIAGMMLKALRSHQNDDIYCGYTTYGVHRDDLSVKINGKEARSFGSQGQQRSAVLALKLAEAAVLEKEKGESPVILLDDVLSELDQSRKNFLLKKLDRNQVFITCCENITEAENIVRITEGKISKSEE